MNSYLCESHRLYREGLNAEGDDSPVCLALAVIHTASGAGWLASAGMEPPLLVRASGEIEEIPASGLLLGVEEDQEYRAVPFYLGHGDTLLMTTDGITEARQGKELLGLDGLRRLVQGTHSVETLERTAQAFFTGARAFGGGHFRDDACLVLARRQ